MSEVRLRMSMAEAEALRRLLRGDAAARDDDTLLDRVTQHVCAQIGTVRAREREGLDV